MYTLKQLFFSFLFLSTSIFAQDKTQEATTPVLGHTNTNKFKQLYDEFSTPNMYRAASGAPGVAYYQQRADYKMDIELDDDNAKLSGFETITYTNNSPDELKYLWVQLDQNMREKDSKTPLIQASSITETQRVASFTNDYLIEPFDGGFNIEAVQDTNGKPLPHMINRTMMRIELPEPLISAGTFSFTIKWWYHINNHVKRRGRSGYEYFPKDGNRAYVIAQFFPRMAVYSDVEGWQNSQFWGRDEFALPFGDYEVNISVPADHILDGTGVLTNRKEVFSKTMMKRFKQAQKSYDIPILIVTQEEAEAAEKTKSTEKKTWKLHAKNVRDFGFATSRKFIWDMMAVEIGGQNIMAVSMYPKEGNPLWEDWSTKAVASTLKSYSRMTFDYPYHKAISVHAKNQGMEYPMICWNYGRPDAEGNYSDRTKFGMMSVIIHEVGHNFFPMIVNSDERQWTWMDEGLNTFVQYVAEQDFARWYPKSITGLEAYPSRRGPAAKIVNYMGGDQNYIAPIMTKGLNTYQFGNNAYGKPATALNILRETVMGRDLFDYAFREYSRRWMFKHPTPEDFFRTMEDASAFDLDWFWRGWFYTTEVTDIGIEGVRKFYATENKSKETVDFIEDKSEGLNITKPTSAKSKYFYEITFNKPGGLVMPIIVEYTYDDGSKEKKTYPAQIWRYNDKKVTKAVHSDKQITKIVIDPDLETADVDLSNNSFPKTNKDQFSKFKTKIKN